MLGRYTTILGTDPAAGVEIAQSVPAGKIWRLHALSFQLVTDVTAITREVRIVVGDGANIFFMTAAGLSHTASETWRYSISNLGLVGTIAPTTGVALIPLPLLVLLPAYTFATNTVNLQAGDDFGQPNMYVEEL